MADSPTPNDTRQSAWARPVSHLQMGAMPEGMDGLNLEGRQLSGPIQGFGPMWQRVYRVRLSGLTVSPQEVVGDWKENFAVFQPPENHFYPPLSGIRPGEIVFIQTRLPFAPGTPGLIPIRSGVMILYSDDTAFTVMTPEGFPISGFNTFSAFEEDGCTVAEIRGLIRTSDPIYEFGFRFMGGETREDQIWFHVLQSLARRWGLTGIVQFHKELIDPSIQWRYTRNIVKNAAIRTFFYMLGSPLRRVKQALRRRPGGA